MTWEDRFDTEFPSWPDPEPVNFVDAIVGTKIHMQFEADRDHRDREMRAVKRFIRFMEVEIRKEYEKGIGHI